VSNKLKVTIIFNSWTLRRFQRRESKLETFSNSFL